jgi:hypothetical protein
MSQSKSAINILEEEPNSFPINKNLLMKKSESTPPPKGYAVRHRLAKFSGFGTRQGTEKPPEKEYLLQSHLPADVKMQISYIDLLDGILIKPNGFFFDQRSWINQGYWSWKNIADQLPYDYEPG